MRTAEPAGVEVPGTTAALAPASTGGAGTGGWVGRRAPSPRTVPSRQLATSHNHHTVAALGQGVAAEGGGGLKRNDTTVSAFQRNENEQGTKAGWAGDREP